MATLIESERLAKFLLQLQGDTSQNAFALRLGVSGTAYRDWLGCRIFPNEANLRRIAQAAGWSLEELKSFLETGAQPEVSEFGRLLESLNQLHSDQALSAMDVLVKRLKTLTATSVAES